MKIVALNVSYNNELCGYLAQCTSAPCKRSYMYIYAEDYLAQSNSKAISLSLPLRKEAYYSEKLFGFFDNLLSEGWLKREQSRLLDINEIDHFSLSVKNGADMAGAVTVSPDEKLPDCLNPIFAVSKTPAYHDECVLSGFGSLDIEPSSTVLLMISTAKPKRT